jgi:Putative metallopeptidase
MKKCTSLMVVAAVVGFMPGVPTLAVAQSTDALSIADNGSIYIDGRSFKVVPRNAEGDASALIKKLDARSLGPGATILRSGDKLYIAIAPSDEQRYGSDRYGSDRYGSDRYGSDRAAAPPDPQRFGSDRYGSDRYGSDRYGSDRYGSDRAAAPPDPQRFGSDRYGSDRYGSDRYGSDRADAPPDPQRFGSDRYGSDRYGSDRYGSDRAAAPPDPQRFGSDRYGSDRYGSDRYGSDRYGSDRYGSDRAAAPPDPQRFGSDRYGSDRYGSDRYGSDRAAAPPDPRRFGSDLPNRIRIEYAPPQNPDQQKVYDLIKEHKVLETLQQILSPFRFPAEVTIKTMGCNGMINSWYNTDDSVPTVHMCYELLQDVLQNVPKETTPTGITPRDAVVGQFLFWTLHEFGHAVFDIYQVPLLASEEDSADRFATFIMLQFGHDQARRLIGGAAYAANEVIKNYNQDTKVEKTLQKYSSVHGLPEQRFFNLLCLAYGADPKVFADVVDNGYLPKRRAGNCEYEYQSFARAFREIIGPHVDKQMARTILDTTWLPQSNLQPLVR